MRISRLASRNFTSLSKVNLRELPDLVVLIGKNSSGKSNVLDALGLLFTEFGVELDKQIGELENFQHLFSQHDTSTEQFPIVEALITLTNEEWANLLSIDIESAGAFLNTYLFLQKGIVARGEMAHWVTLNVSVGDFDIVDRGEFVADVTLIQPDVMDGEIPEPVEIEHSEFIGKLSELLKINFHVIHTTENLRSWPDRFSERPTIIDSGHIGELWEASQSSGNRRRSWTRLTKQFEHIAPNGQRPAGVSSSIQIEEDTLTIPIGMIGEGSQSMLRLIDQLNGVASIVAIEEPETHLHPGLVKQIGRLLSEKSQSGKQIFVCTHSPFLVEQSALGNFFIVKRGSGGTEISSIGDIGDLKDALLDIGMRPSDILFSDAILLVEGLSDDTFFSGASNKINSPLVARHIKFIRANGYPRGRRKIEFWAEVGREAGLPLYLIVDQNARTELDSAIDAGQVLPERCLILNQGNLEDCYPWSALQQAWSNIFDVTLEEPIEVGKRVAVLKNKLPGGSKGNAWKDTLAQEMVKILTRDEIESEMPEIAEFIRKIYREVGST